MKSRSIFVSLIEDNFLLKNLMVFGKILEFMRSKHIRTLGTLIKSGF